MSSIITRVFNYLGSGGWSTEEVEVGGGGSQPSKYILSKGVLEFAETAGGAPVTLAITAVDQGGQTFTVFGNAMGLSAFSVDGSTGNDGDYTVAYSTPDIGAQYDGTHTVLTVNEAIPDATVDGDITYTGAIYSASVDVVPGGRVLEVVAFVLAGPWDADTAVLAMGDEARPGGYLSASIAGDLVGQLETPYDAAMASVGVGFGTSWIDGYSGDVNSPYSWAASWYGQVLQGNSLSGVPYPAGGTVTAQVLTTGAGGVTGRLVVDVIGFGIDLVTVNAVKS